MNPSTTTVSTRQAVDHLRITLRTSDQRTGLGYYPPRNPFLFDRDGDGETLEADIEALTSSSEILAVHTITGDEWRSLDDCGDVGEILTNLRCGADLPLAIASQTDWWRNKYLCPCGTRWNDQWSCMVDDRCPTCDTAVSPYDSEQLRP